MAADTIFILSETHGSPSISIQRSVELGPDSARAGVENPGPDLGCGLGHKSAVHAAWAAERLKSSHGDFINHMKENKKKNFKNAKP